MSWKMFWQIVLLMVIGGLVLLSLKCGMSCYRSKCPMTGSMYKGSVQK
ncbi:hypothetical protein ACFL1I_06500 [Candidatus Omnitrophota bacterium]